MKTTALKRHKYGFCLNETELRRLIDTCKESLSKIDDSTEIKENYEVILKNGAHVETFTLEDVYKLENHGKIQVAALIMKFHHKEVNKETDIGNLIDIIFNDSEHSSRKDYYSIYTKVTGDSRDWTLLTSSLIQDRIDKIKRRTFYLDILLYPMNLLSVLFLLGMIAGTFAFGHKMAINDIKYEKKMEFLKVTDSIYYEKYFGEIQLLKDTINSDNFVDYFISHAKMKKELLDRDEILYDSLSNKYDLEFNEKQGVLSKIYTSFSSNFFQIYFGFIVAILFLFFYLFIKKYYPLYNFVWGDYAQDFQKKNNVLKFFFITALLGITLSIIANKLTNLI